MVFIKLALSDNDMPNRSPIFGQNVVMKVM